METGTSGCIISIPLEVAGESFAFVTLDDGTLIIEDQQGEEPLEGVASVIERRTDAPYRARGFRIDGSRWVVVADPIELIDLGELQGEAVTVVAIADERRLVVDGAALGSGQIPPDLLAEADDSQPCVISAGHIDDEWWELTVEELPREVASGAEPADEEPYPEEELAADEEPAPVATRDPAPPAAQADATWTFSEEVDAPGLVGDSLDFVLADAGTLIVLGAQQTAGLLVPFRTRIEATLHAPYRVHAERLSGDAWRVQARPARIERFTAAGQELELTHKGGLSELVADGQPRPGTVPRLEVIGLTVAGPTFVARATHLRDDLWDVRVDSR
jgi:hypothetical protein